MLARSRKFRLVPVLVLRLGLLLVPRLTASLSRNRNTCKMPPAARLLVPQPRPRVRDFQAARQPVRRPRIQVRRERQHARVQPVRQAAHIAVLQLLEWAAPAPQALRVRQQVRPIGVRWGPGQPAPQRRLRDHRAVRALAAPEPGQRARQPRLIVRVSASPKTRNRNPLVRCTQSA